MKCIIKGKIYISGIGKKLVGSKCLKRVLMSSFLHKSDISIVFVLDH